MIISMMRIPILLEIQYTLYETLLGTAPVKNQRRLISYKGALPGHLRRRYRHHLILSYLDDRPYKPMFDVKGADSADSADTLTLRLLAVRPTGQLLIFF
jgi:hypothetical protein